MSHSIGIIGAGITGLATAHILSSAGHKVTIVAREQLGDVSTNWASPWAGAVFHPQRTPSESHREMQRVSFRFYWDLAEQDKASGVERYEMTEYFDDGADEVQIWFQDLMPDYRVLPASELPPGVALGIRYTTLALHPTVLLEWFQRKLISAGVEFVRAEVASFDEARKLTGATLLVNASGLGARVLAGDEDVRPVRGQTMFVKSDFGALVMREGAEYTYVIPRPGSGGVILGGIKSERLDGEVDVELKKDILARVNAITKGAFESVDLDGVVDLVGFRPGREGGLRVEREGNVVHAYGVGGAGYIYSVGVADRIKRIIAGRASSKL